MRNLHLHAHQDRARVIFPRLRKKQKIVIQSLLALYEVMLDISGITDLLSYSVVELYVLRYFIWSYNARTSL